MKERDKITFTVLVNRDIVVKRNWYIAKDFIYNDEKYENVLDCIYSFLYTKNGKFDQKIKVQFELHNVVSEFEFNVMVDKYRINIKEILPEIYKILMNKKLIK